MREIRPSGSEGGGTELNRSFLPLSLLCGTCRDDPGGVVLIGACSIFYEVKIVDGQWGVERVGLQDYTSHGHD